MPLTVKNCQHPRRPGRHSDGKGLYLLVKPKPDKPKECGARSWVLRVQHNGRRRDFGLGSYTDRALSADYKRFPIERRKMLTLTEAREKAAKGRKLAKAGIDPSEEWRIEEKLTRTFEEVAQEYHGLIKKAWRNGKHREEWLGSLERYAFPTIGKLSVDDIDASTVQRVLLPIWLTKGETARRVKQRIAAVLDYAHGRGWRVAEAPMRAVQKLMGAIKQPQGGNFASMPYLILPAFMAKLGDGELSVGRLALRFLILTAARSGEVRGATWREIDLEAGEWSIPGERMKAGKPHIVPLVPAAIDILKQMQGLFPANPKDDLVFPGLKGPMSDATLAKVMRVNGGVDCTVHGFRSSFRDWAADTGFADSWAEAALAHNNRNKTEAAYRRTTFFDQRRDKLMPSWASFVLGDGSNVISLAERRA